MKAKYNSADSRLHGVDAVEGPTPLFTDSLGKERRAQVNKVQKMLRVQKVASWLLEGNSYTEVVIKIMDKWGLSEASAEGYHRVAREQVEAANASDLKSATVIALYRLAELYSTAMDNNDLKVALDVVKTQSRMLGLNAPDKIETSAVDGFNSMDIADQLKHVSGIIERAQDKSRKLN